VLLAPRSTVIGATNPAATAAFLAIFGGQPVRVPTLDAASAHALYGTDAELSQIVIHEPGSDATIRIVETPNAAPLFQPLLAGPYGVDYYTRDLELSVAMLVQAGAKGLSPLIGYTGVPTGRGPEITGHVTNEMLLRGPDELCVFLTDITQTSRPWPTLLSADLKRTHSELLQLCWVVEDMETERSFWVDEAGMTCVLDEVPELDQMQALMFTPGNSPLRCVHVTDAPGHHKIELMCYPEEAVGHRPHWPLRAGLHSAGFVVADLDVTRGLLPSAHFGDVVTADIGEGPQRAVAATTPGGSMRFELWETPR
jgi:hypothetical protein